MSLAGGSLNVFGEAAAADCWLKSPVITGGSWNVLDEAAAAADCWLKSPLLAKVA
jgi:hypothetical protein